MAFTFVSAKQIWREEDRAQGGEESVDASFVQLRQYMPWQMYIVLFLTKGEGRHVKVEQRWAFAALGAKGPANMCRGNSKVDLVYGTYMYVYYMV